MAPEAGGPPRPPLSKRDAKAQFRAAKAISKSQRSWPMRHKIITGSGIIIIVIIVAVILNQSGSKSTTTGGSSAATTAAAAGAKIGTAARDGKFEFTVTSVTPGTATVGTAPLTATAQGQFVVVHLTVKNIGTEAQLFDQSSQVMLDQNGNKLSTDITAGVYLDSNNFLTEINPGNSIKGLIVFDIAKTAVPTQLILHDSAFSGGVTVSLK